jgi:hypothetical protein
MPSVSFMTWIKDTYSQVLVFDAKQSFTAQHVSVLASTYTIPTSPLIPGEQNPLPLGYRHSYWLYRDPESTVMHQLPQWNQGEVITSGAHTIQSYQYISLAA